MLTISKTPKARYSLLEFLFCSDSPHVSCSKITALGALFSSWSQNNRKTCCGFLGERCHHGFCYDIIDRPLPNIKIDQHLFSKGSFLLFSLLMMSGTYTKKNCQQNRSGRELLITFAGDVSISGLKWKSVGDSLQLKRISKHTGRRWSPWLILK